MVQSGFPTTKNNDEYEVDRALGLLLTSMPKRASTVSLLESLAFRSPTSPLPWMGVAKCMVMDALDPPAAMPHSDLKTALRHSAVTRRPGIGTVLRAGENVSRMTAVSFSTSASSRNFFASGDREEPTRWAERMARGKCWWVKKGRGRWWAYLSDG
jgi:hypothetical protein